LRPALAPVHRAQAANTGLAEVRRQARYSVGFKPWFGAAQMQPVVVR